MAAEAKFDQRKRRGGAIRPVAVVESGVSASTEPNRVVLRFDRRRLRGLVQTKVPSISLATAQARLIWKTSGSAQRF
jgi:hypothetical protein